MRALEFITGHVIYNPAYTYKFQLKTTEVCPEPRAMTRAELLKGVVGKHALLVLPHDKIDEELVDAAGDQLKVIGTHSVG